MQKWPFTVLDTEVVFDSPWTKTIQEHIQTKDWKKWRRIITEYAPGVSVIAIDSNDIIYLAKYFAYAINKEEIAVVSGAIDSWENPEESAKRELCEELGISAWSLEFLQIFHPISSQVHQKEHIYIATDLELWDQQLEDFEYIERIWVTLEEAIRMVKNWEITEPITCYLIQTLRCRKHTI